MAFLSGEPSHKSGNGSSEKETTDNSGGRWYFSRKEIEEDSPSRRDGIDLRKETYLRKSYCTFLQDFGMRLKIPQVTIATAIVFCHRFFLRQSHAKNDRRVIATVCLFLAGKVEETPRTLKEIIIVSYEVIHKKDPSVIQKIKQKDVFEQQKELILLGERIVLATLGFDLNVYHPYKPLVEAIKKLKVAQNALAQVAWNFVNDGLRTSLCLQYKPHLIAAGAIFLAAKFLKVKLPSDGEVVWWQEFDVTPRQLEDVSNQMLELYEQNHAGQSTLTTEAEGNVCSNNQSAIMASTVGDSSIPSDGPSCDIGMSRIEQEPMPASACPSGLLPQIAQKNGDGDGSYDNKRGFWDHSIHDGKVHSVPEAETNSGHLRNATEISEGVISDKLGILAVAEERQDQHIVSFGPGNRISSSNEAVKEFSSRETVTDVDKIKIKAALEKTRRLCRDVAKKNDTRDNCDLRERELANGIELSIDEDISNQGKYRDRSSSVSKQEPRGDCFDQKSSRNPNIFRLADQRTLVGSAISRTSNIKHDQGEEEGSSSLDEQQFPSPRYHSKAVNSKHLTGVCGNARPDGLKRNRDSDCAHSVNEKVVGSRRHSEGWRQHDAQFPREAPFNARLGYPERELKRPRYATHG